MGHRASPTMTFVQRLWVEVRRALEKSALRLWVSGQYRTLVPPRRRIVPPSNVPDTDQALWFSSQDFCPKGLSVKAQQGGREAALCCLSNRPIPNYVRAMSHFFLFEQITEGKANVRPPMSGLGPKAV